MPTPAQRPRLVNRGPAGLLSKKPSSGVPSTDVVKASEIKTGGINKIAPSIASLIVPIESLILDPENARLHPERNMEAIKGSLTLYGQVKPVVVRRETMVVVAGNGTMEAAKALGWTKIAASIVDMTVVEAAGYGLADNRTAELAKWDFEVVARLDKLLTEAGQQAVGWSRDELEVLRMADWTPPPPPEDDPHITNNSGNEEWYTPPEYIEAARRVMGEIDLDPASCEVAQAVVQAGTYYTKEEDGLAQEWAGRVWMNPPYTDGKVGEFTRKLAESLASGAVAEAVVLVNNSTDTKWFADLATDASALCLVTGRIKFFDSSGQSNDSSLQGQVFVYCGPRVTEFASEFSEFGVVALLGGNLPEFSPEQNASVTRAIQEVKDLQSSQELDQAEAITMACEYWLASLDLEPGQQE